MNPQPPRGNPPISRDPADDEYSSRAWSLPHDFEASDDRPEWEQQAPRPRGRPRLDPNRCADCKTLAAGSKYCDQCRPAHLCSTCGMDERADRYECNSCRQYRYAHGGEQRPYKLIRAAWLRRLPDNVSDAEAWERMWRRHRDAAARRPDEAFLAELAEIDALAE